MALRGSHAKRAPLTPAQALALAGYADADSMGDESGYWGRLAAHNQRYGGLTFAQLSTLTDQMAMDAIDQSPDPNDPSQAGGSGLSPLPGAGDIGDGRDEPGLDYNPTLL